MGHKHAKPHARAPPQKQKFDTLKIKPIFIAAVYTPQASVQIDNLLP